ncbi:hypothetical protein Ahy_B04g069138 isoform B [Arachis hypogaea]|uniref:RNA helicase n=1 Tax=Arachis hypogaea TaxID=3818 RepID=A0A444ZBR4_ARAHY|nr:hypothetical protein Ahy_B04g069138 isoform B [Arachis hypogaea]
MLILGAIFNCLDPIMTVVAGLSVRDPFLMPADKKDLAESAKAQFSARDYSDHLALVRAYEGWKEAEAQQAGYEYCWQNFLSSQTLRAIDSLRKQFCYLLKDIGLVDHNSETYSRWSHEEHLVRAVICAASESHDELLSAVRLVISEDHCDGRFIFGRRATPAPKVKEATNSKSSAGVEAENFKNQLQTLLNRAGHEVPTYKTRQLKNNQFRSTINF